MEKHAYLIIAHHQIELLKVLLELIDDERNDIYIHIDKKSNNINENEIKRSVKYSNVIFIPQINITWGGTSQIQVEVNLLKEATKSFHSYYHLISGVDLPIKTQNEIFEFFSRNNGKEFISFDYIQDNIEINYRAKKYHFFQEIYGNKKNLLYYLDSFFIKCQRVLNIDRKTNKDYELKKGSNWFSITDELARYIVSNEKIIKKYFKYTRCCDEIFLQTIVYNSPFKEKLYYDNNAKKYYNMRHIDFKRGNPYTFTKDDYLELISTNEMFARKFNWNNDKEIILMLKEYIEKR